MAKVTRQRRDALRQAGERDVQIRSPLRLALARCREDLSRLPLSLLSLSRARARCFAFPTTLPEKFSFRRAV